MFTSIENNEFPRCFKVGLNVKVVVVNSNPLGDKLTNKKAIKLICSDLAFCYVLHKLYRTRNRRLRNVLGVGSQKL
jgi:hypothetical protein